ncbi:hypothetical protein [Herbaspirillum seropedicae]|uniref:hypothetical protein n=1 Tax=Herbaspirillum seropedicae TaxID=964 RepID=UPI00285492F8|nr:hypothetical protein [Herbaspirillum seropedicae]MDR6396591.1 hypothetical protein [Herbaspirillum seropedicae]
MPILSVMISAANIPSEAAAMQFTALAARICETTLHAAADKVQIQLLATVVPPHGRDAYMELRYRESANRNESVMNTYMEQIEKASADLLGIAQPRIRCFPQQSNQLFARN